MNTTFPKRYFAALGLVSLLETRQRLLRCSCTAICGTVCTVVWEDGGGDSPSYPIVNRFSRA